MLLPLRPEPKEGVRREAGWLGTLALKRQKMKVCFEQDSNPPPSACETCAFLLCHQAFHTNKILEVVFKVEGRGDMPKDENPHQTALPLTE